MVRLCPMGGLSFSGCARQIPLATRFLSGVGAIPFSPPAQRPDKVLKDDIAGAYKTQFQNSGPGDGDCTRAKSTGSQRQGPW